MGLIFLLLLGMALGWVATIILQTGEKSRLLVNVLAGIGGALLAGIILNPLIGLGDVIGGRYKVEALMVELAGAVVLLVAVNLLRDGEIR
ncbi:GlsB/YeaQ/YmgE family stress response membrane protein [Altererythrobacter sp. KTW20L]|uniref:GlsB/YeaQ/YmgE family stress response membrane protein n=1 Tax=Altererythrobacter sp. KTW20L TaxID=2942210 RepID=UPI0020BDDD7E|nr:GlsB/YeaQ/YmgE family stress response membrane protein [Altererythrobacter sp. KTW20L]MCL6250183.1 GlsB/YeaQ/YmgE family stress response membrane protein [Altererythrobacter sp. KTW20L]